MGIRAEEKDGRQARQIKDLSMHKWNHMGLVPMGLMVPVKAAEGRENGTASLAADSEQRCFPSPLQL